MTKLNEVVRGVEEKIDYDHNGVTFVESVCEYDRGYNSLASAEVVVDREKLIKLLSKEFYRCAFFTDEEDERSVANAIATAIESGSIISLKEDR